MLLIISIASSVCARDVFHIVCLIRVAQVSEIHRLDNLTLPVIQKKIAKLMNLNYGNVCSVMAFSCRSAMAATYSMDAPMGITQQRRAAYETGTGRHDSGAPLRVTRAQLTAV